MLITQGKDIANNITLFPSLTRIYLKATVVNYFIGSNKSIEYYFNF